MKEKRIYLHDFGKKSLILQAVLKQISKHD